MKQFFVAAALVAASVSAPVFAQDGEGAVAATAQVEIKKGQSVYTADGKRIGKVYQLSAQGDPQIIRDMRLVTVPASTISNQDGKLVSSLTLKELSK